jgi:hypothetical protein
MCWRVLQDIQNPDIQGASNAETDTVYSVYLPCITPCIWTPIKKLSGQCAFICKEIPQIWFLAMQICRILHDTHSVSYLLQCWCKVGVPTSEKQNLLWWVNLLILFSKKQQDQGIAQSCVVACIVFLLQGSRAPSLGKQSIEPQALRWRWSLVNLHDETEDDLIEHKPLRWRWSLVNLHDETEDDLIEHKPKTVFEVSVKATMVDNETIDWLLFHIHTFEMKVIFSKSTRWNWRWPDRTQTWREHNVKLWTTKSW